MYIKHIYITYIYISTWWIFIFQNCKSNNIINYSMMETTCEWPQLPQTMAPTVVCSPCSRRRCIRIRVSYTWYISESWSSCSGILWVSWFQSFPLSLWHENFFPIPLSASNGKFQGSCRFRENILGDNCVILVDLNIMGHKGHSSFCE